MEAHTDTFSTNVGRSKCNPSVAFPLPFDVCGDVAGSPSATVSLTAWDASCEENTSSASGTRSLGFAGVDAMPFDDGPANEVL
jgi:hypothetical protein